MKLALENIGHAFLGRTVFENVNLTLNTGEVVALIGPSGCGKTTVLQIAAGLIEPIRGRVRRAYQRHAVVFQEPRLLPWMTARDNIAYGLRAGGTGRALRNEIAERRATEVGLHIRDLQKYPAELSGGMRKRVGLARAIAGRPEVILYDEPTTGLDPVTADTINELIVNLNQKIHATSIAVTHDMASAFRIGHRIVMLSRGKIVFDGTPEQIQRSNDPMVRQFIEGRSEGPLTRAV